MFTADVWFWPARWLNLFDEAFDFGSSLGDLLPTIVVQTSNVDVNDGPRIPATFSQNGEALQTVSDFQFAQSFTYYLSTRTPVTEMREHS